MLTDTLLLPPIHNLHTFDDLVFVSCRGQGFSYSRKRPVRLTLHPTQCVTANFMPGVNRLGVRLTSHFRQVPMIRTSVAKLPLPLPAFWRWWGNFCIKHPYVGQGWLFYVLHKFLSRSVANVWGTVLSKRRFDLTECVNCLSFSTRIMGNILKVTSF
jgi:hypothetical protein